MLVNDDGIAAPGIWALYDALCGDNEVTVCAPHAQCSGFSHSISIAGLLRARRFERGGARAYEVFGTPADCVLLGIKALCERAPELVISGINDGYNSAMDVHYSGTIGAAMEARLNGVPALAASTHLGNCDLSETVRLVKELMGRVLSDPREDCIYSLNVPMGEVRGLRRAPLGGRYEDLVIERARAQGMDAEFSLRYLRAGSRAADDACDRELLARGFATYTALRCDWTLQDE